jgi:TonB family protein
MREVLDPPHVQDSQPTRDLQLVIRREPWLAVFFDNLRVQFTRDNPPSRQEAVHSAAFWSNVFVERSLPWKQFLQSAAYHVLMLALIWSGSRFLALQPRVTAPAAFTHADVVYYTPSEYLPPLDTRRPEASVARKADPEYSAQPIISVPLETENRSQSIVTPPSVRLHRDVALPNLVALLEKMPGDPRMPIGPAPAVPASEISRIAPRMERAVVAPPPEVNDELHKPLPPSQAAVIAPPPQMELTVTRRGGDLNIGHSSVIAPAPQLALDQQRALRGETSTYTAFNREPAHVIAPPPSLGASGRSRSSGSMIALSLHPAVGAPPDPPAGNRRGNFAATPEGRRDASGAAISTENLSAAAAKASGSGKKSLGDVPSGLYVGKADATTSPVAGDSAAKNSNAYSVNPKLIANARLEASTLQPEGDSKLSQEERAVFGNRKFYSLSLSMPNLNSAGGSWIVRFAARKSDSNSGGPPSRDQSPGELSEPAATSKVDPAYPLELMRQNLGGTVILYAVIHADGTVGGVRVLRSVDERLDQYAGEAIAKWKFAPATRNGIPVDVEATFWIPFRPERPRSNF